MRSISINNPKILIPKTKTIKKFTTYIPKTDAENLRKKLFGIGAGSIGKYETVVFPLGELERLKEIKFKSHLGVKQKIEVEEVCVNITF